MLEVEVESYFAPTYTHIMINNTAFAKHYT